MKNFGCYVVILILSVVTGIGPVPVASAQQANAVVPTLVKYSGTMTDVNGKPLTGVAGVTFLLYKDEQGGAPLWLEMQNVTPDENGHYTVVLGSTTAQGLPTDLFASGEARWLAVQEQGQAEQPRVLLLSVPYALKAGDAQTIGGLPASAFVLAAPGGVSPTSAATGSVNTNLNSVPPPASSNVTTTGGTVNTIPLFTTGTNIQNSLLTQTGTAAVNVSGKLNLPAIGPATATAGFNSRPHDFVASAFNSGTKTAVPQTFQLQAEPAGNNTSTASGTLNLLYATGTGTPAETGLKISSKGLISFATGQTFPGAGSISGVTAGIDLTGGGTTGKITLNVDTTKVVTSVKAGTALTGGGTGGALTLSVDTTKIPQLAANNTFTGNQAVSGSLSAGSFTGNGASLTNVNASALGGLAPSAFAQLNALNNFSQAVFAPQLTSTGSAEVDNGGSNAGNYVPGLQFGPINSGETIASGQAGGSPNPLGLDFYTNATVRMSITNSGVVGIGVQPIPTDYTALYVYAPGVPGAANIDGVVDGIVGAGAGGGTGVSGWGGDSLNQFNDGSGGVFQGGGNTAAGDGIDAFPGSGVAGHFEGDVTISGNLSKGGGSFKIDHPLDPANKYLYHSFVESPDMMNIYNGVATLDASGEATIQMPEWFSSLNRDFRYQLTCIGGFAPVYIAEELANNQFKIGGGRAGMRVSWEITGIRQDAWANAHRIPVEEEKSERERGFYLHPELYGAPPEKQVEWTRHPRMMRVMQENHRRMKEKQAPLTASSHREPHR